MRLTLSPAYGRDYRSAAALLKDWNDGKDFMDETYGHPRKPINKPQVPPGTTVNFRYDRLRKAKVHKVS